MTRHNLSQHLNWFLDSQLTEPPQPVYAPTSAGLGPDGLSQSQTVPNLSLETGNIQALPSNVNRAAEEPEFARPLQPASALNTFSCDAMARLQSGPKSGNKPRLLSENIPVPLRTPLPSTIRKPGTSLKDQYSAQWERKDSGTAHGFFKNYQIF